jgi:hypothetical protein
MFDKIGAAIAVFRKGGAVVDAARVQGPAMAANLLAGLLMAVVVALKQFGLVDIPLDDTTANSIAIGALAVWSLVNGMCHAASSRGVGIPGLRPAGADDGGRVASVERTQQAPAAPGTVTRSMDTVRPPARESQPVPMARPDRADDNVRRDQDDRGTVFVDHGT